MEDHDYVMAEKGGQMEIDPMSHQLKTTCNFGTKSKLLTWYSGGLNHQIEHHLCSLTFATCTTDPLHRS